MQRTISIISDWKKQDYYLTALSEKINRLSGNVRISEISHNIINFDTVQAAFVLRSSWSFFPKNSIHLFCVNSESSENNPHVLIKHKSHYFIGVDHGHWNFICKEQPEKVFILNNEKHYKGNIFPELNIFAPVAASLIKGAKPEEIAETWYDLKEAPELLPIVSEKLIEGSFIYFDSYGNGITNIDYNTFKIMENKKFRIKLFSENNTIKRISRAYQDVRKGELCAVFNNSGLIEIAIREGNLKQLLDLQAGDAIRIEAD